MSASNNVIISKRLVTLNSASFILARMMNISVIIWLYQYLLQRIPVEEFAVYPVVASVMMLAPLFFSAFTGGITRYVIDAYARDERVQVTSYVSSITPLIAGMALVFIVIGTTAAFLLDEVLSIPKDMVADTRIMMIMLVLSYSIQMTSLPFICGFHVRQRFVEMNALMLLREIIRVAALLVLLTWFDTRVIWIVVAAVVAELGYTMIAVLRSRHLVPDLRFRADTIDRGRARKLVSFGVWTTLGQLGNIMYTHAGTIILNLMGSPRDVTIYFIGATLFRQLEGIIVAAIAPLQTVITALQATDRARIGPIMQRGARYALWVSLAVAVPLIVFAEPFMLLYLGPDYRDGAIVIIFFMVIFFFNQATVLLPMTCIAMARVREFILPAVLFQAFGLLLMIVLVGPLKLGAAGVAFALALITVASQLTYFWWLGLRVSGLAWTTFVRETLVPGWTPALVGFTAWIGAREVLSPDTWLVLAVDVALGGAVYVVAVILFGLPQGERHALASAARNATRWGLRGGPRPGTVQQD